MKESLLVDVKNYNDGCVNLWREIEQLKTENERLRRAGWMAAETLRNDMYKDRVKHALQYLDEIEPPEEE